MDNVDIGAYIKPLIKWWWLLVLSALVAGVSSALYTMQQPDVYRARTTAMVGSVLYDPNPNGNNFIVTQQLAQSYADMAKRQTVQQSTMDALGIEWLPSYNVWVVPNSAIIEFAVDAHDPEFAQAVASELVNQLILLSTPAGASEQEQQAFVEERLLKLRNSIQETEAEIERLENTFESLVSAREIAEAEAQIAALESKLNTLDANYGALLATTQQGAVNTLSVIEPASLPRYPMSSGLMTNVLLAAMVGMVLAAAGAYLIEYIDDTFKQTEDVTNVLDLSTLGTIPLSEDNDTSDGSPVLLKDDRAFFAEAYRMLRTNLQFASVGRDLEVLLVSSPSEGEGKSTTVANLGAALAKIGKSVVLVDADLRRPRLHQIFRLVNNVGLTTALLGDERNYEHLLHKTTVPGLRVLTAGPLPPNPAELLDSQRMRQLIAELKAQADIVILDSPPVTLVSDTAILATQADGVLLVLRHGKTRRELAKRAVKTLRQVNAYFAGVVLNGVPLKSIAGYNYNYGYSYGYTATRTRKESAQRRGSRSQPGSTGDAPSQKRSEQPSGRRTTRRGFTLAPQSASTTATTSRTEFSQSPKNGYYEVVSDEDKNDA